jgi:hypothetical protein
MVKYLPANFFYGISKNAAAIFKYSVNIKNKLIKVSLFIHRSFLMEYNRFKAK